MLDVHPPHEPVHGVRDFLLHLFTITIGLLIALSLEGCVEWQHHRHLVRDAEESLQAEIRHNDAQMEDALLRLHQQQGVLKQDLGMLSRIEKNPKETGGHIDVSFDIHGFQDVGWKTAQSTGALSYMPYGRAEEYSDIYGAQDALQVSEQQAARDAVVALGQFMGGDKDGPEFTPANLQVMQEKIEVLQGQLLLVDTFMKDVNNGYKKFLSAHPQ